MQEPPLSAGGVGVASPLAATAPALCQEMRYFPSDLCCQGSETSILLP